MSMKPVRGIILAADRDLVAVALGYPEVAKALGQLSPSPGRGDLYVFERDGQGGYDKQRPVLLHGSKGGVGTVAMEPEVVEQLQRMGVYRHIHLLEGRSASFAARLIDALARHARVAVDNDYGVLLSAEEFRALGPERQAEFVVGAGDFYRLRPIADLERPGAGTHDAG